MTLYKILNEDGTPYWGGKGKWHLPKCGKPGKWMPPIKDISLCEHGYHVLKPEMLLYWLGPVIFEVEVHGAEIWQDDKGVVEQARLVRKLSAWNEQTARLLACDYAEAVVHLAKDQCSVNAIRVARRFAFGLANREELNAVWDATWKDTVADVAKCMARTAARVAAAKLAAATAVEVQTASELNIGDYSRGNEMMLYKILNEFMRRTAIGGLFVIALVIVVGVMFGACAIVVGAMFSAIYGTLYVLSHGFAWEKWLVGVFWFSVVSYVAWAISAEEEIEYYSPSLRLWK